MKKIITKNAPLFATAVLALSTLFTASHANTASEMKSQDIKIDLGLKVYSDDFRISTKEGFDITKKQEMRHNPIKKELEPLKIPLILKSKSGEIKAKLNTSPELISDIDSTKKLEMKVSIGGTEIDLSTAKQIGNQLQNKTGTSADLVIEAKTPSEVKNLDSGYYQGTINIMFEGDISKV